MKRPEFAFPGAWFQLYGGQDLHIVCVPDPAWRARKVMEVYETHVALREAGSAMRWKGYTPLAIREYIFSIPTGICWRGMRLLD